MKKWSDIQRAYPFFWLWLNAWLKSKGADSVQILSEDMNSEICKVRFTIPYKEREVSDEMLNEMLDEAGIRVCIDFNSESIEPVWRYVVYKNGMKALWTQTYSSNYIFGDRKSAQNKGFLFAIREHNESLKKQNAVAYH
jgi:hypothetical protein